MAGVIYPNDWQQKDPVVSRAASAPQPAAALASPTESDQASKWQSWDFSALERMPHWRGVDTLVIVGVVSAMGGLSLVFTELSGLIALLGFVGLAIWGVFLFRQHKRQRDMAYQQFAETNGLKYTAKLEPDDRPGSLFQHGHSKRMAQHMQGVLNGWDFGLFNYIYVTGHGKHSRTHYLSVAEFTLPHTMPHMIIDSQLQMGGSVLPVEFDSDQRIKLEGDFDQYFHIFAPENYQVAALSILTPDVMQVLLSFRKYCDIEIVGNRLYFYWSGTANEAEEYKDILSITQRLLAEIGDKLRRGDVFATEAQAQLHSGEGSGGIRLKKSSIWFTILGVAAYFLFRILLESNILGESFKILGSALFIFGIFGAIVWQRWRVRRLRRSLQERQL